MDGEELLSDAIGEEDEEEFGVFGPPVETEGHGTLTKAKHRNARSIVDFLGNGPKDSAAAVFSYYYCSLMCWATKREIERDGWIVTERLGYHDLKPAYQQVDIALGKSEECLADGQFLLTKGALRLVVTVDTHPRRRPSVQAEARQSQRAEADTFIGEVKHIVGNENFYKGAKLRFEGQAEFIDVAKRTWEQVILDADTKQDIKSNTLDFLRRAKALSEMGVPSRRGVLLSGPPGTGKTVICKALMNEAEGISCISVSAYNLNDRYYINQLYEFAEDIKPSIVFIEDIDLIAKSRTEYHGEEGPPLNSLLEVLDGLQEQSDIVTVATTNNLDALDEAIVKRPSRFDRVITIPRPATGLRRELVDILSRKVRLNERIRSYITRRTERFTPAQVQEVVFSLAIECSGRTGYIRTEELNATEADVDRVLSRINGIRNPNVGFRTDAEQL